MANNAFSADFIGSDAIEPTWEAMIPLLADAGASCQPTERAIPPGETAVGDNDPPEMSRRSPTQKEVLASHTRRSRWPGLSRAFGLDPNRDYKAEQLAEAERLRLGKVPLPEPPSVSPTNLSRETIIKQSETIIRPPARRKSLAGKSAVPNPSIETASPMHARDRRFWVVLGIWAAIAVAAVGGGIGALASGSPHWGFALCAVGLMGAAVATLHLLETKLSVPKQRYVHLAMLLVAAVTWIFVGWQTWLWVHVPAQGYTQIQLDKAVNDAVEKAIGPLQTQIQQLQTALNAARQTKDATTPTSPSAPTAAAFFEEGPIIQRKLIRKEAEIPH